LKEIHPTPHCEKFQSLNLKFHVVNRDWKTEIPFSSRLYGGIGPYSQFVRSQGHVWDRKTDELILSPNQLTENNFQLSTKSYHSSFPGQKALKTGQI